MGNQIRLLNGNNKINNNKKDLKLSRKNYSKENDLNFK